MQDILMFLITFFVIMLAFSCGVSYMFNYLTDGTGSSTGGVFTYFFWVLLQVGFMVLYVLHLTEGTGSSTRGVFIYFFLVLLQVGFMVLHVLHLTEGTGSSTSSTGSFSR
jgi:hypothetical protein